MRLIILALATLLLLTASCSHLKQKRYARNPLKYRIKYSTPTCKTDFSTLPTIIQETDHISYETDSVRFYISAGFFLGFSTYDNNESQEQLKNAIETFGPLFANGMITGSLFEQVYEITGGGLVLMDSTGKIIKPTLYGYGGKAVKILRIAPYNTGTPKVRGFEIWATTDLYESGWGGFPVFYLEVHNPNGSKTLSLQEFVKGAEKSCFSLLYLQI